MGRLIFVVGGARCGKSKFANRLAARMSDEVVYIATGQGLDQEMKDRIRQHRRYRRRDWKTLEEPQDLVGAIDRIRSKEKALLLIDCLTLWISNLLCSGKRMSQIRKSARELLKKLRAQDKNAIIVSNEVGFGIVPDNEMARTFIDLKGRINQMVAKDADEVYLLVSGLPVRIK